MILKRDALCRQMVAAARVCVCVCVCVCVRACVRACVRVCSIYGAVIVVGHPPTSSIN